MRPSFLIEPAAKQRPQTFRESAEATFEPLSAAPEKKVALFGNRIRRKVRKSHLLLLLLQLQLLQLHFLLIEPKLKNLQLTKTFIIRAELRNALTAKKL